MLKFVTIIILSFCLNSWAEIPRKELSVALSDVAPFGYSEHGQFKGINYDIFEKIGKEAGLKFSYTLYPHARIKNLLPLENPDLVIIFAPACHQFSDEYEIQNKVYRVKAVLYLNEKVDPTKIKDARVGRVRGTCVGLMKDSIKPENVFDLTDLSQALAMMDLGRLEGVCALETLLNYNLKKHPEFKEHLVAYKKQTHAADFDAVICRKKNLPEATKAKLEHAAKSLKFDVL